MNFYAIRAMVWVAEFFAFVILGADTEIICTFAELETI